MVVVERHLMVHCARYLTRNEYEAVNMQPMVRPLRQCQDTTEHKSLSSYNKLTEMVCLSNHHIIAEVETLIRPTLYKNGQWFMDDRRLRVSVVK